MFDPHTLTECLSVPGLLLALLVLLVLLVVMVLAVVVVAVMVVMAVVVVAQKEEEQAGGISRQPRCDCGPRRCPSQLIPRNFNCGELSLACTVGSLAVPVFTVLATL